MRSYMKFLSIKDSIAHLGESGYLPRYAILSQANPPLVLYSNDKLHRNLGKDLFVPYNASRTCIRKLANWQSCNWCADLTGRHVPLEYGHACAI
jgi:hypothetical protein